MASTLRLAVDQHREPVCLMAITAGLLEGLSSPELKSKVKCWNFGRGATMLMGTKTVLDGGQHSSRTLHASMYISWAVSTSFVGEWWDRR
jgi:hypothetical protein